MSGGSFNYLYGRDDDINPGVYEAMADEMDAWPDAQLKIQRIAILLRQAQELHKEMADIMHDVEWWQSCDYSQEQVTEGVVEWRKKRGVGGP